MIDQMKNLGLSPKEIEGHEFEKQSNGKLSEIYNFYQERLKNYNSVDFGDLILLPLLLLRKNNEILNFYQKNLSIFLVDEYQDTNATQYMFLRILSGIKKKIFVVLETRINQYMVGEVLNLKIYLILIKILIVQR